MADLLTEIRERLAAKLGALTDMQVVAYMLANPTPPTVEVFLSGPGEIAVEYDSAAGRGLDEWMFTVRALVGVNSDIVAQQLLDALLAPTGARSIKAVLEAKAAGELSVTLDGVINDLRVTSATGYRLYTIPGSSGQLLGCEWFVHVWASGK